MSSVISSVTDTIVRPALRQLLIRRSFDGHHWTPEPYLKKRTSEFRLRPRRRKKLPNQPERNGRFSRHCSGVQWIRKYRGRVLPLDRHHWTPEPCLKKRTSEFRLRPRRRKKLPNQPERNGRFLRHCSGVQWILKYRGCVLPSGPARK